MSRRREILGKDNAKKWCKTFLPSMLEMPLMHVGGGKNYFMDIGFTMEGFPQIVYIFDNIDYEPLMMDIYKLQNHSCFVDIEYADDNKEVVIYLDVPREFRKDFDKFIQGGYSEFSDRYKQLLIEKYGEGSQEGVNDLGLPRASMHDIIYPEPTKRKLLAEALSVKGSSVNWRDLKEIVSSPDTEYERFKTIEELVKIDKANERKRKNISHTTETRLPLE